MESTEVLPELKVSVSMTENQILNCLDLCSIAKEALETFAPKEGALQLENLMNLQDKFYQAHNDVWQLKEIKTRKNGILQHQDLTVPKNHQRLMDDFHE